MTRSPLWPVTRNAALAASCVLESSKRGSPSRISPGLRVIVVALSSQTLNIKDEMERGTLPALSLERVRRAKGVPSTQERKSYAGYPAACCEQCESARKKRERKNKSQAHQGSLLRMRRSTFHAPFFSCSGDLLVKAAGIFLFSGRFAQHSPVRAQLCSLDGGSGFCQAA